VLLVDGIPERRAGPRLKQPTLAEKRLADLESVFAALAHEQRRHILLTLRFRGGQMTAGAIADRFACSWPTTTRHLRVLEEAGLVAVEKRGRERIYKLEVERLLAVAGDWLAWFRPEA
jgi:DNA-binding transcriptional ArsR family regulator